VILGIGLQGNIRKLELLVTIFPMFNTPWLTPMSSTMKPSL